MILTIAINMLSIILIFISKFAHRFLGLVFIVKYFLASFFDVDLSLIMRSDGYEQIPSGDNPLLFNIVGSYLGIFHQFLPKYAHNLHFSLTGTRLALPMSKDDSTA